MSRHAIRCACGFDGDLVGDRDQHRDHHDAWASATTGERAPIKADHAEDTAILVAIDQLIAHAYNPNIRPELTYGAQAILARSTLERNSQ